MNKVSTIICLICLYVLTSCKKEKEEFMAGSNVWVVNSSINLTKAVIQKGGYSGAIGYGGSRQFALQRTELPFIITDSISNNVFSQQLELKSAAYSIFIAGQMPMPEVIIKEEIDFPFIAMDKIFSSMDSVVNVRFINLSPNSVPLRIKVSTSTTNEADALAYKEITTWRPFKAAPAATTTYSIQIRNASTDALVTTYTFAANATKRFKNVTLMIRGLMGTTTGTNAFGVTEINYF